MNKIKYWARWISVIPGAIITSFLITFPLHWLLYFIFAKNGTILGSIELPPRSDIIIEYTIYPFVIAIIFILIGQEIAPKYKFKTAIILFLIYSISWSMVSIVTSQFSFRSILAIIGAILGLFIAKIQSKQY